MILADTSVWIQHFRQPLPPLIAALTTRRLAMHPVILGELAIGNLAHRQTTLKLMSALPWTKTGSVEECLTFLEVHKLYGRGLGWNDVQLLVASRLSGNRLWTLDKPLAAVAAELDVASDGIL